MPVGVKILLDTLHLRFFFIVNLVENGQDIVTLFDGVLSGLCPKFVSDAHMSELEHDLIVFDTTVGKILSKIDDEEVGNESSNDGVLEG